MSRKISKCDCQSRISESRGVGRYSGCRESMFVLEVSAHRATVVTRYRKIDRNLTDASKCGGSSGGCQGGGGGGGAFPGWWG